MNILVLVFWSICMLISAGYILRGIFARPWVYIHSVMTDKVFS